MTEPDTLPSAWSTDYDTMVRVVDGLRNLPPEHVQPRTGFTDLRNRPDNVLGGAEMKWCAVCRCWDAGLVEAGCGAHYRHNDCPDGHPHRAC